MEITEVRVKLVNGKNDKLRAFCSITIDNDFVIRDLKVIDGQKGPFVAMPSRKRMEKCSRCGGKNHYRARYCNDCGIEIGKAGTRRLEFEPEDGDGRSRHHTEIAHPINARCREMIQTRVLEEYREERRGVAGGRDDTAYDDYFAEDSNRSPEEPSRAGPSRPEASRNVGTAASAGYPKQPAFDEPRLESRREAGAPEPPATRPLPERRGPSGARPGRSEVESDKPLEDAARKQEETEPDDNFGAGIF